MFAIPTKSNIEVQSKGSGGGPLVGRCRFGRQHWRAHLLQVGEKLARREREIHFSRRVLEEHLLHLGLGMAVLELQRRGGEAHEQAHEQQGPAESHAWHRRVPDDEQHRAKVHKQDLPDKTRISDDDVLSSRAGTCKLATVESIVSDIDANGEGSM